MHCLVMLASTLVLLATALAPPAQAGPILNEVCYDGSGSDAYEAFTEILGPAGMSLSGWALRGINGADGTAYRTISLTGATIPSDGLLVVATSSATGAVLGARDLTANVDWQNGPDAVLLLDSNGAVRRRPAVRQRGRVQRRRRELRDRRRGRVEPHAKPGRDGHERQRLRLHGDEHADARRTAHPGGARAGHPAPRGRGRAGPAAAEAPRTSAVDHANLQA